MLQSVLARALLLVPIIGEPFRQVGELSGYAEWKRDRLPGGGRPLFAHRERLWDAIRPELDGKGTLTVMEFGVAWGYATNWWLERLRVPDLEWHGFDTFTGLPTTWDRAGLTVRDKGAFSAEGHTPPIDDARVHWHVGDVTESLNTANWDSLGTRPMFVLFDFDLYEPTIAALTPLLGHLKPGDVLYFDEGFDSWNERRAIDELLLPRFQVECLGSTATALALKLGPRIA
jgi:hypothetical protein